MRRHGPAPDPLDLDDMTATLDAIAAALPGARQRGRATLDDATHDSRQARPGTLFCAIRGSVADGHDHATGAVEAGASALLVDHWLDLDCPQLRVDDVRAATGPAAAVVHGRPSDDLAVVGITGTNGKTTISYLVEAAAAAGARGTGLVGTVETRIHGLPVAGIRTTPEGTDLQRILARMRDRGVEVVAMEASSHGLVLHRLAGTRVAVAVFSNLSQDHLDFHRDMEDYAAAKAQLFQPDLAVRGVVDVEGPWGRWIAERAGVPVLTVGPGPEADVLRTMARADLDGTVVRLDGPPDALGGHTTVEVATPLVGAFNGRNAADAFLAAVAAGVPAAAAAEGIAACLGAPGRLERVDAGQEFTVLVDYAHTPDAVETVVTTLRELVPPGGRVILVVGAGGDRDRGKRPLMGAAAATADVAVLTTDNPRSEEPGRILDEVHAGARVADAEVLAVLDRRDAIAAALGRAGPDDVVVVAGKGHETTQEFADHVERFDDRLVAAALLGAPAAQPAGEGPA